jgi:hypothetical protein
MFIIQKLNQPGQHQVLANMKAGGQNSSIGDDPTIFPKSENILGQMYSVGCSAVVDASKFFYQFMTHLDNQKYMGLLLPPPSQWLHIPIPRLADEIMYSTAFLRLLREQVSLFQGTIKENTWHLPFEDNQGYNPGSVAV